MTDTETLIDIKKLLTFKNYGRKMKFSRQWVYMLAKEGKIQTLEIDGVKFVQV